ncbi:MAG: hypothetical protein KIT14_24845 [bacterium]|nr:hypothetical protein [bacterium]
MPTTEVSQLATVGCLVTAADADTVHRDVYLRRAAALLAPLVTPEHHREALASRARLDRLLARAHAAVTQQDWPRVRELGREASALQHTLAAEAEALAAADAVYGAPPVVLDPLSAGLPPSKRWSTPGAARVDVLAALDTLAAADPPQRALYAARRARLEALALPGTVAATPTETPRSGLGAQQQALLALERGDAEALERLADGVLGAPALAATDTAPTAAVRVVAPAELGAPLPDGCAARAGALGLEAAETILGPGPIADAVATFVERWALGASPAVHDRARDGVARLTGAAREIDIPVEIAAVFAETISLFALHQYVNSAGVRFVPVPVPREILLVEGHAEGDETPGPLLRALGLERRRGLARDEIEAALLTRGADVVADRLGLDPLAFRLVCVPPDAFMRLGRTRGWGSRPEWTHFDGYQVLRGGRLRALVGGNAQFGGLFDLCSIASDDGRENTLVRFAVIRRERLAVRLA